MPRALLTCVALLLPTVAQARITLAVLDLKDSGVGSSTAENLTDVVTASLAGLGVFDVLSRSDIQQMVRVEQDKQLLGCESDVSCVAELGGALGVAMLVTGSIGKVSDTLILNLSLIDARAGRVLNREQRKIESPTALTSETEGAARYLVRDLLAGLQGDLILRIEETGADVEIDGHVIGVTPLARQSLAGGPHRVRVVKKGFVAWARDVDIKKDEPLVVDAALVPSLEFIEDYDSRASTWRTWAYVTGGTGIGLLAASAYTYLVYNAKRADDFEHDVAAAGCGAQSSASSVNCDATFGNRRDSIRQLDTLSGIGALVGVLALGTGVYLYTEGPEPGAYDRYKPATAAFDLAPRAGGWVASTTLRF